MPSFFVVENNFASFLGSIKDLLVVASSIKELSLVAHSIMTL